MDNQLTFGTCAALLKANGFVPAPLSNTGTPIGPFSFMQIDYARYAENADAPVAVLTSVPAPRNPEAPVQNARDTWLVSLTVKVRDELVNDVDAIIAKYIGNAKCPVRIGEDGSTTLRVFKLGGGQFSSVATDYAHDPDFARVESAASFVPVNGDWRGGISLLDVFRSELPELDHERAQQLIGELNALLDERAPPVEPPAPFVPRPLLEPGQRLVHGNTRAMDTLRENGFSPLPIRRGQQEVERDGYSDFLGRWHFNVDITEHGVAFNLKGFALLEFGGTRFRADVDAAIRAMGPCLIRTVPGDDRPAYLFRCLNGGGDEVLYSPNVHVKVRRSGVIVLAGEDEKGREYEWDRDVLTVKASTLAMFELHDGQRLRRVLESLPPADYSKATPAPKRPRKTA